MGTGLLLCCLAVASPGAAAASLIVRFVFTTEQQTIPPGVLSEAMTVQARNAADEAQQSDETIDMAFSSTSATGEFLSAGAEPVKPTMNKGTANRTFYYRDASAGTHALTVTATGRTSGQSWTASHKIIVGTAAAVAVPSAESGASPSAPAPAGSVSALPPAPAIAARAGRDRTVIAGAAVMFEGGAAGLMKEPVDNARFWWNFGDGGTAEGKSVSHAFRIPGTYTTGLHVSSGVYAASDYSVVTVVPNQVEITEVTEGDGGFIRMRNGGAETVDIGGWILEGADGRRFVLPPYTMIRGGSDIALAHAVTALAGTVSLTVRFPDGSLAQQYVPPVPSPKNIEQPMPAPAPDRAPLRPAVLAASASAAKKETETGDGGAPANAASSSRPYAASAAASAGAGRYAFLGLAALVSAGASAGFFFLKRFFI